MAKPSHRLDDLAVSPAGLFADPDDVTAMLLSVFDMPATLLIVQRDRIR
jgi:hypothetical protein